MIDGSSVTSFTNPVLSSPTGLAFDPVNGELYVANSGTGIVSSFNSAGQLQQANVVTSGLGAMGNIQGMTFDSVGDLFVVSKDAGKIYEIAADGTESLYASTVTGINDVAFAPDGSGNLYVSTGSNDGLILITPPPTKFQAGVTINGPKLNGPDGLAFDSEGNLYVVNDFDPSVEKFVNGAGSTFISDHLSGPRGIIFDSTGQYIYVADDYTDSVSEYNATTGAWIQTYSNLDLPSGNSFSWPIFPPALLRFRNPRPTPCCSAD